MILERLQVQNFRCLRDVNLPLDPFTVLVGANGAGKSAILRALQLFYDSGARYTEEDFFNRNTAQPIELATTFGRLSQSEENLFRPYVQSGKLSIAKVMTWPIEKGSQRYHGVKSQCAAFAEIRKRSSAREQKEAYESIRKSADYSDLPAWSNQTTALRALQEWEASHPTNCVPARDDGQFFGFRQVGEAKLERYTRFVPIKAVEDAETEGAEGKATPLTQLMDLVVRETLRKREELVQLEVDFKARSDEVLARAREGELKKLESDLSTSLAELASGAGVKLDWSAVEFEVPLPSAAVRLVEDEYAAPVGSTGHGLQRLFMIALLQRLAAATSASDRRADEEPPIGESQRVKPDLPSVVLGIEEPELYQHPNRQRSLAHIFQDLVRKGIPEVASQVQIICSTHSPVFLNIEQFNQVRLFRKVKKIQGQPRETIVAHTTLEDLTREMERIWMRAEGSFAVDLTRDKLRILMTTDVSEGFFAGVAVLVEGPYDRALIAGFAAANDFPLDILGISLIPCTGKPNLLRPAAVFRKFGIPTYVVWDNDRDRGLPEENRRLLRFHKAPEQDFPVGVESAYSAFERTLESSVEMEVGASVYKSALSDQAAAFDNASVESLKSNPRFYELVFRKLKSQGIEVASLSRLVSMLKNLAT